MSSNLTGRSVNLLLLVIHSTLFLLPPLIKLGHLAGKYLAGKLLIALKLNRNSPKRQLTLVNGIELYLGNRNRSNNKLSVSIKTPYANKSETVSLWIPNNRPTQKRCPSIKLEDYETLKGRIMGDKLNVNPYNFLTDKSVMNQLKRELFGNNQSTSESPIISLIDYCSSFAKFKY